MSKIFAIYPTDKRESTRFLNKVNTFLLRKLDKDWHCFKIRLNNESHRICLQSAKDSYAKFILFMGHGRSNCLYGSCSMYNSDFISSDAEKENEQYYKNEKFIDENNIGIFENKIFFSFSCNSNENKSKSIGRKAMENGVLCFVGFGDMPTDYIEKDKIPLKAIATYKGLLTKILKESIYVSIINNYTVDRLVDLIKILTYKEIQQLLLQTKNRYKNIIINKLIIFKNDIQVFGNRFETMF